MTITRGPRPCETEGACYDGLAAVIGVLLFVAVAIDHPFGGDVTVTPAPLERVLHDFAGPT